MIITFVCKVRVVLVWIKQIEHIRYETEIEVSNEHLLRNSALVRKVVSPTMTTPCPPIQRAQIHLPHQLLLGPGQRC